MAASSQAGKRHKFLANEADLMNHKQAIPATWRQLRNMAQIDVQHCQRGTRQAELQPAQAALHLRSTTRNGRAHVTVAWPAAIWQLELTMRGMVSRGCCSCHTHTHRHGAAYFIKYGSRNCK